MPKGRWLIIEIASAGALLFILAVILLDYSSLPLSIYTHFSWNGAPRGMGEKSTLLVHLFVSMTAFAALSAIPLLPRITASAVAWCRVLKLEWMLLHGYLIWAMVRNAQGRLNGLGAEFHTVLLAAIFSTILFGQLRNPLRRVDNIARLALIILIALVIRGWEPVRKAHALTYNTLGSINVHSPTADLFLWTACALIFYFGTKMWASFAPHVFELSPERADIWRARLRWTRLVTTLLFLVLTLITLYRYGYNFR